MCLRAIKTKHYSCSAHLSSVSPAITSGLWLRPVRLCWYYANFVSERAANLTTAPSGQRFCYTPLQLLLLLPATRPDLPSLTHLAWDSRIFDESHALTPHSGNFTHFPAQRKTIFFIVTSVLLLWCKRNESSHFRVTFIDTWLAFWVGFLVIGLIYWIWSLRFYNKNVNKSQKI